MTRTVEEFSIVCPMADVPEGILAEKAWRGFKIEGPLDFRLTGVQAALARTLAEGGVSIFALATHNTDYLLVKEGDMSRAVLALTEEGQLTACCTSHCAGAGAARVGGAAGKYVWPLLFIWGYV
jgi:hypothetical protein